MWYVVQAQGHQARASCLTCLTLRREPRMRQGSGYAYGDGEDCISYKCEGCGQRVRVTPTQARQFRGAFTACSRLCILKARDIRTQQWRLDRDASGPSEAAAVTSEEGRRSAEGA